MFVHPLLLIDYHLRQVSVDAGASQRVSQFGVVWDVALKSMP